MGSYGGQICSNQACRKTTSKFDNYCQHCGQELKPKQEHHPKDFFHSGEKQCACGAINDQQAHFCRGCGTDFAVTPAKQPTM